MKPHINMVNFGQKTAILSLWNSRQKKYHQNGLKPLWFHKKDQIEFWNHFGFTKKTFFKNTNVNRHVGSAENINSGQRRRPFCESESVFMLNKDANKSLFSKKYRAEQGTMVYLATFFVANSLKCIFFRLCKNTLVNQWNFIS